MAEVILNEQLSNIAIDYFLKTKLGQKLDIAMQTIQDRLNTLQTYANAMAEKDEDISTTSLKVLTVMTFAILQRIGQGQDLKSFSKEDWKDILSETGQISILLDEQKYTVFVFMLYEKYIRYSADCLSEFYPEKAQRINLVADELKQEHIKFYDGLISEPIYVEDCLWISLDAMIKLLASCSYLSHDGKDGELSMALFEFARLKYYQEEYKIVQEYIDSQYQMDDQLQLRYVSFLKKLQLESEQYQKLIDNAFSSNFREAFLGSIALAKASGVEQKEILTSISDVDDYFL